MTSVNTMLTIRQMLLTSETDTHASMLTDTETELRSHIHRYIHMYIPAHTAYVYYMY